MLATNVIVAPNSPIARAKARIMPATIPGAASGAVIVAKTMAAGAPRVLAAASSCGSTVSIDRRIARTISGKPITAAASAAPVQRNEKTRPQQASKKRPKGPCRPKLSNSSQPVTTGGMTSGKWTRPLRKILPGKLRRASR
jgi:hypothetical protein